MAGYSSWVATDDWRVVVEGSVSNSSSSSTCTVSVTAYVETWYGGFTGTWYWYTTCGSSTGSTQSTSNLSSTNTTYTLGTQTYTVTKTTSSQTYTVKAKVYCSSSAASSYQTGATASTTVTIPALASYTITYNANGGSGAPSSQTKYYGKTLTLSSTVPTRSGYTFLGWSTSSSATSATYSAGGSYTANASATLYAVWKAAIVAPTLSSFSAYRCDSSGTADDEGTYAYCSIKYSADTGYLSSNVVKTIVFSASGLTSSTVSPAAQSGTATTILSGLDTDTSYTITAKATDTNGSTTSKTAKIGVVAFLLDFSDTGEGVGILAAAPDSGVRIGGMVTTTSITSPFMGTWYTFTISELTICCFQGYDVSNASRTTATGNIYRTDAIEMPDYPVTWSNLPATAFTYIYGDTSYRSPSWVGPVTDSSDYAPLTNPGPVYIYGPTSATLGHPRISVIAIGVEE